MEIILKFFLYMQMTLRIRINNENIGLCYCYLPVCYNISINNKQQRYNVAILLKLSLLSIVMDHILNNLSCPICIDICVESVESSCCHKLYCKNCVDNLNNKCSMCRSECVFQPSELGRRLINALPAECEYCNYKCSRGDLKAHVNKCDKSPIQCPIDKCVVRLSRVALLEHIASNHSEEFSKHFGRIIDMFKYGSSETTAAKESNSITIGVLTNNAGNQARLGRTGKYYCGQLLDGDKCDCCNGFCGKNSGCNCSGCMRLDIKARNLPSKGWLVNREGFVARKKSNLFYCGRKVMQESFLCSGYCGPAGGPNCNSCQILDKQTLSGARYSALI